VELELAKLSRSALPPVPATSGWLVLPSALGRVKLVSLTLEGAVMKMRSVGMLGLILAVCLSSVMIAQEEGRGRGGPGRGGPGGGGRGGFGGGMGMSMGSALELLSLLRMEEVQTEIGLSPDAYKAVQSALPDMRSLFQADESERAEKLKEANAKAQDLIDEALSPKQQTRLLGLLVQQQGMRALSNELVAKQLGLDAAKTEEIKAVMTKAGEEMRDKMREAFSGGGGDREKMREMFESMGKELDQAVAAKLSDEQKKALEELKGDAFTFPERRGFGGPGGRGPGGGGPGGGRNRGGDNNN
jgi:hypothetical protein